VAALEAVEGANGLERVHEPVFPRKRAFRAVPGGQHRGMRIGAALILMAVGGILADAVTVSTPGIDLNTAGSVLFFTGLLGLLITVGLDLAVWRRERPRVAPVERERRVVRTDPRYDPVLPPRRPPRDPATTPTNVVPRERD
jgi:hypothetical protein